MLLTINLYDQSRLWDEKVYLTIVELIDIDLRHIKNIDFGQCKLFDELIVTEILGNIY